MPRVRSILHLLVLILIAAAVGVASYYYRYVSDWTNLGKHSLSVASTNVLDTLPGNIRVTSYLAISHPMRDSVADFIARYQRVHPYIDFNFIDPSATPQLVRDDEIKNGEIVLEYKGRKERVTKLSEQTFTSGLARLVRNEKRFVVFISGHGERSPNREANHDMSEIATVIRARGINIQEVNLTAVDAIPDNTSLVVVASPQLAYLKKELQILAKYIAGGGNFLWLSDPEEPAEMLPLAEILNIDKITGTIVDPASLGKGLDNPALLLNTEYTDHPALEGFNLTTLFVYASAFVSRANSDFSSTVLLRTSENAWSETSELEGNVGLDDDVDFPGPLPLALALVKDLQGNLDSPASSKEQRIAVLGDGDFIANAYLGNAGNQDFGVRLIEWLISDDELIDVPSRAAIDTTLELKKWHQAVIGFGFLFVIPGALLINGIIVRNKRKRA
jgi:hypothetical protein